MKNFTFITLVLQENWKCFKNLNIYFSSDPYIVVLLTNFLILPLGVKEILLITGGPHAWKREAPPQKNHAVPLSLPILKRPLLFPFAHVNPRHWSNDKHPSMQDNFCSAPINSTGQCSWWHVLITMPPTCTVDVSERRHRCQKKISSFYQSLCNTIWQPTIGQTASSFLIPMFDSN